MVVLQHVHRAGIIVAEESEQGRLGAAGGGMGCPLPACGFTEPWGKYGYRLGAAGEPRKLRRCPRCGRICCHRIQKRQEALKRETGHATAEIPQSRGG